MVWYTNQSLLLLVLCFLLGLLVGYLWWGLRLRRVRSAESTTESAAALAPAATTTSTAAAAAAEPAEIEPTTASSFAAEPVAAETDGKDAEPATLEVPVADTAEEAASEGTASEGTVSEDVAPVDAALVADVESAFAETPGDELERIEGIGPKIATALRAAGITTFGALADAERSTVEDALDAAGLRFAPSLGTWSEQARLLADGDEAGFKELTDRLVAGRVVAPKPKPGTQVDAAAEAPANAVTTVDTDTEPTVEADPEPVSEAEPIAEPEPVNAEAEPIAEPEPIADPEPVSEVEPEPIAEAAAPSVVEPETLAISEPEPLFVAAEAPADDAAVSGAEAEAPVAAVPAQAVAAEDLPIDDLKRVEGIGPKMSAALVASGIRTFAQLAAADVDTLRAAIEAAGLRFAPSIVTWARQAQLLADGDEDGFADLTRRLVAGRDTGRA